MDQQAEAELRRLNEEEAASVHWRYAARFQREPPTMSWPGSEAELERLMEKALARGSPLTMEDLWQKQGRTPPPLDSEW